MSYKNFTDETVFADSKVNVLCNRIYDYLIKEDSVKDFQTTFCITGTVSKIIQGAALSEIPVIAFITNSADTYLFCSKPLAKLLGAKVLVFKNRVQMQIQGVYLEFWLTSNIGTIDEISGFFVQDTADIPTNIK